MITLINIESLKKYKNIYMIGIGGTSMSGIAEILKNSGYNVAGSDIHESIATNKLIQSGINVTIGHNPSAISNYDLVVYSAAVKDTDPEIQRAKELNIPTLERKIVLGEITRAFRNTICVSGTHGKSTTTNYSSYRWKLQSWKK